MKARPGQLRGGGAARRLVAAATVGLGAAVLAACSSSSLPQAGGARASASRPAIPLASSTSGGATTWATLAMGVPDDPDNTFWQVMTLSGAEWHLATPPGVASNGGLVVAATASTALAGFGPSQHLRFSPVASTVDQGANWQAGILPAGLMTVPDALTLGTDRPLALLAIGGGRLVAGTADLSTWLPDTTVASLRRQPASAGCHPLTLTAVSIDAGGTSLVGASCARGGHAGLFARSANSWSAVGPVIPGASDEPTEVVRLDQTAAGTSALVAAGSGRAARLYGMWSADGGGPWTVSDDLPIGRSSLLSTGVSAAGGFTVVSRSGSSTPTARELGPNGSKWSTLPPLPPAVTSVTADPAGGYDALAPVRSTLSVYRLQGNAWLKTQTMHVAIPYGSSG